MGQGKPRHKPRQTPRLRLFTDEFEKGDRVSVIRARHGWHDGGVEGVITEIWKNSAVVTDEETGYTYEIDHPRDIRRLP